MILELFIGIECVFSLSDNSILLCLCKYFKDMVFRKSTESI